MRELQKEKIPALELEYDLQSTEDHSQIRLLQDDGSIPDICKKVQMFVLS